MPSSNPSAPASSKGTSTSFDPWKAIPRDEFVDRHRRGRDAAQRSKLDGLVAFARGIDGYGDVLYLVDHYSQWPFPAEHIGLGLGRPHSAVVLAVDGPYPTYRGGGKT